MGRSESRERFPRATFVRLAAQAGYMVQASESSMDLRLTGKAGLVTGASKGIGRAIALRLAKEGMDIAALARNETQLRTLASEIESLGRRCLVYPADLTAREAPEGFVKTALADFGRIDLLVNNAGATRAGIFSH